jgi:hypothetical protein
MASGKKADVCLAHLREHPCHECSDLVGYTEERQMRGYMAQHGGANARQMGGAHYKSEYQHWDWVAESNQDYFTGHATKYLSRNRKKGMQKVDLEKCIHYIDKLQELTGGIVVGRKPQNREEQLDLLMKFAMANDLRAEEIGGCWAIVTGEFDLARERVNAILNSLT